MKHMLITIMEPDSSIIISVTQAVLLILLIEEMSCASNYFTILLRPALN